MSPLCFIRKVKQNLLSNVPAADSRPNHFGISFLLDKFHPNWLCNVVRRLEVSLLNLSLLDLPIKVLDHEECSQEHTSNSC